MMRITDHPIYRAIYNEIDRSLAVADYSKYDRDLHAPVFVREMCERIVKMIGREDVTLVDIISQDRCASGHIDYHRKFALYCTEKALMGQNSSSAPVA